LSFRFQQAPQPILESGKLSIKPVYNVSQGAITDFVPLEAQLALVSFNYPDTTIAINTETLDSVTAYQSTSGTNRVLSNIDTISGYSFGDDTQLDYIMFVKPFSSFEITQCFINAAFTLNVSAYTSGDFSMDSIDLDVLSFDGTSTASSKTIFNTRFTTGFGNLTAAGTQTYIMQAQFGGNSIKASDKLGFRFRMNVSVGVGTRQELLLPFFYWTATAGNKKMYESGISTHMLPSFDAAQAAFKDQLRSFPIDTFGAPII